MTTLEIILAELDRQHEASRAGGLGCFDATDPKYALIDGRIDLAALAAAIDKVRRRSFIDPAMVEVNRPLYSGEIKPGMCFTWMRGTPGECLIKVKRISTDCPDDPWVYARVLLAADKRIDGKEYGNETSRFREAVELEKVQR